MYWSHADPGTYRSWLDDQGYQILWETFLPEGAGGHPVILAEKRIMDLMQSQLFLH
jgi:hypothetical protein